MAEIIINCANDQDLAVALYSYLLSCLHPIDKSSFVLEKDEIYIHSGDINRDIKIKRKDVAHAVESFLKATKGYENHGVNEFCNCNIITIGIPTNPEKLMDNLLTCEMCNYLTQYEEQLWVHRVNHGVIAWV